MTKTSWRWVVGVLLLLQVLWVTQLLFAPRHNTFVFWIVADGAVALAGRLAYALRGGVATFRAYLDALAAPTSASEPSRGYYLSMLALWIVFGVAAAYYVAFVKH